MSDARGMPPEPLSKGLGSPVLSVSGSFTADRSGAAFWTLLNCASLGACIRGEMLQTIMQVGRTKQHTIVQCVVPIWSITPKRDAANDTTLMLCPHKVVPHMPVAQPAHTASLVQPHASRNDTGCVLCSRKRAETRSAPYHTRGRTSLLAPALASSARSFGFFVRSGPSAEHTQFVALYETTRVRVTKAQP